MTEAAPAQVGERRAPFPPAFLDEVRARTPLPALIGRDVKLTRKGNLWTGLCPFHGERRPSFAVYPDHYHCFSCGVHGDAIRYVMELHGLPFRDAVEQLAQQAGLPVSGDVGPMPAARIAEPVVQPDPSESNGWALKIFLDARRSIFDTPVEGYLKNRKIDLRSLGRAPGALRFHPRLWHTGMRTEFPAMVAAINDGAGHHIATHRTWLEYAGGAWIKARTDDDDSKKTAGRFTGGSIHLWRGASRRSLKDALEGEVVAISEGIETGLSIVMAVPEIRVLCGISGSGMAGVILPPQIRDVILAMDNDLAVGHRKNQKQEAASEAAANRIIARWRARGYDPRIARSPLGKDFNNALQGAV